MRVRAMNVYVYTFRVCGFPDFFSVSLVTLLRRHADAARAIVHLAGGAATILSDDADANTEQMTVVSNDSRFGELRGAVEQAAAAFGASIEDWTERCVASPRVVVAVLDEKDELVVPITVFPIPRLSMQPLTGLAVDGWNRALSSREAVDWVRAHGVDPARVYFVSLADADDVCVAPIGFVRND